MKQKKALTRFLIYHLKRINYLILLLLSVFFTCKVNALVNPTEKFYINDYANIISPETEEYIYEKSVKLNEIDGTQIVVVTVKNLEGRSIEDYSLELARKFGIGSKEKNNGLLLLLALEEREFRVEVGTGLEGILPDGKTGRFQDQYIIPYLKENNFDEGIKNGYNAFYNEIVEMNKLDLEIAEVNNKQAPLVKIEWLILSGAIGFFVGLYSGIFKLKKIPVIYFTILMLIICFSPNSFSIYFIVNIAMFIFSLIAFGTPSIGRRTSYYGGSSYRGSGSGFSSHGGGGSFSGGGSSRHF